MTTNELQNISNNVEEKNNLSLETFKLPVDIYEQEKEFYLLADMPGVLSKNITVDVHEGKLRIEGKMVLDEYDGLAPIYTEFNVGNYYRELFLNENVDTSRISAKYNDGLLKVTLPKVEAVIPRKIEITEE